MFVQISLPIQQADVKGKTSSINLPQGALQYVQHTTASGTGKSESKERTRSRNWSERGTQTEG